MYLLKGSFAEPHPESETITGMSSSLRDSTLRIFPSSFENAHKRLARVQIECLPYEEVLKSATTVPQRSSYLDPPYLAGSCTDTTSSSKIL